MARTPKTRMNDTVRNSATVALMIHATLDLAMALAERSDALATRVYQEMFTPEEHKLLKKVPAGWMPNASRIERINAGGWKVNLDFYDKTKRPDAVKLVTENYHGLYYHGNFWKSPFAYLSQRQVRMPSRSEDYILKDPALATEIQQFVQDLAHHHEMCAEMLARIHSTIKGFKTLEDMLDAIPDLKTLAPDLKAQAIPPETALVTTAESLMCSIAKIRGEERTGCCDGERVEEKPANDGAIALAAAA